MKNGTKGGFSKKWKSGKLLFMKAPHFTGSQIELLKRTLCAELSADDFTIFVQACERTQLDPFARHIYPMQRTSWEHGKQVRRFSPEISIDGFRAAAERTGKYIGQFGPEWCGKDGVWKDIWTESEPPVASRVGILRDDFKSPTWGKALYAEYIQVENGQPARLWGKMAANQLAKCAEALGFRKAFPQQLGGLYSSDEMSQAISLPQVAKKPPISISRSGQQERPSAPAVAASEHGALSSPRPVPSELQAFVSRANERSTVVAASKYLKDELVKVAGAEGARTFNRLTGRLPRVFPTKEACVQAHVNCWLQLWDELQGLKKGHEFAQAVNQ